MKTLLSLFVALVAFASIGAAQNCVAANTCHINPLGTTQVLAENQLNVCVFTFVAPETITVVCKHDRVTELSATHNFRIGACADGNFLGAEDIRWSFCRIADAVFSWQIADDVTFSGTGLLD